MIKINIRTLKIICVVLFLGNVFQIIVNLYGYNYQFENLVPNEETAIKIAEAVLYAEIGDDIRMYSSRAEEYRNGQAWRVSFLLPEDTIGIEPNKIVIRKHDGKCSVQNQ